MGESARDITILSQLVRFKTLSPDRKHQLVGLLSPELQVVGTHLVFPDQILPEKYKKLVKSLKKWENESVRRGRKSTTIM